MSGIVRKSFRRGWREASLLLYAAHVVLIRRPGRHPRGRPQQRTLVWNLPVEGVEDADGLRALLDARGMRYAEGRHSLYVPPQAGSASTLGPLVQGYPEDAGLKVLRDFRPPALARYGTPQTLSLIRRWLSGELWEQFVAGCYLWVHGLGPAIYDITELRTADGTRATAFVVQHVEGEKPSQDEAEWFLDKLERRERRNELTFITPKRFRTDFRWPTLRKNLMRSSSNGGLYYVDQQGLRIHWEGVFRGLFGKRAAGGDSRSAREAERWGSVRALLAEAGDTLEGKLVLDLDCDATGSMVGALEDGARWVVGRGAEADAARVRATLPLRGFTRFTAQASSLDGSLPAWLSGAAREWVIFRVADIPDPAIARGIPWKWMFLESQPGAALSDFQARVDDWKNAIGGSVVGSNRHVGDDTGGDRFLALVAHYGEEAPASSGGSPPDG